VSDRAEARRLLELADQATEQRLLDADARVSEARAELEQRTVELRREMSRAVEDDGWSQVRISKVLGVSHQRINMMMKGG